MNNKQMMIGAGIAAATLVLMNRIGYQDGQYMGSPDSVEVPAQFGAYIAAIFAFFIPKILPFMMKLDIPGNWPWEKNYVPPNVPVMKQGSFEEAMSHIKALRDRIGADPKADKMLKELMGFVYDHYGKPEGDDEE